MAVLTQAYLDNSATTPVCASAAAAVAAALTDNWGNPSSVHAKGVRARRLLEDARAAVAQQLACLPEEVFFTSGGTESNNIAVFGAAKALKRRGNRIVTSCIEHPSVLEPVKRLEEEGFEVVRLPVDAYGRVDENSLFEAVNSKTVLVSLMSVNNEVGSVQPAEAARKAVTAAGAPALVHCDAVQSFGKLRLYPAAAGIDLMSVSAHKIHGPKGAGALYIRKGVHLLPPFAGGTQEGRIRPGTEPLPAVAGFGAACAELPEPGAALQKAALLKQYMLEGLEGLCAFAVNSPPDALPYLTNLSFPGIKSEVMLNFLAARGVFVSSGSACSKGRRSKVLAAMGLSEDRLESPVRVSFSRFTEKADIDALLEGVAAAKQKLLR
ncbi:MAG TPA: cysteine desulfurase family protein [Clostridiales bacterium]|nr:cysteine desulfurase family protein [Clostridiales bacterium]HQK73931.1 cysteine desulfurase family protein [Clostridiales bacterium]